MSQQRRVMTRFFKELKENPCKNYKIALDRAVVATKTRKYDSLYDVQKDFLEHCENASSPQEFLEKDCGIILANDDVGSFFGSDMGGDKPLTNDTVIFEESIKQLSFPSQATQTYSGLNVTYPYSGLTAEETFIVSALHTWWIPKSLGILKDALGYDYETAFSKAMLVRFIDEGPGMLAYVATTFDLNTGKSLYQTLTINLYYYADIDVNDRNGRSLLFPNQSVLDRTILHEMTHGVMMANILWARNIAKNCTWFMEGSAELMRGLDDERPNNILYYASHPELMAKEFNITYPLQNSTNTVVLGDDADPQAPYSIGYMFLRYMARQIAGVDPATERRDRVITYNENSIVQRGIVYDLEELADEFCQFAKLSKENVPVWDVLDTDRLSSFYGATIGVPIYKWRKSEGDEPAYYYISFQHQFDFNKDTYKQWLQNKYLCEASPEYEGSILSIPDKALLDGGEYLAIGLHTQYDEDLYMCEQGGYSARTATRFMNGAEYLGLLPAQGTTKSGDPIFKDIPLYPGTGCPWFILSETNRDDFNVDNYGIQYWFIKRAEDASITIRYQNNDKYGNIYQSISFGLSEIYNENSHILPLFIGGGASPFTPSFIAYTPRGATRPSYKHGLAYTTNVLLSAISSTILHPLKLFFINNGSDEDNKEKGGANQSENFKVLLPDGNWVPVSCGKRGYEFDEDELSIDFPDFSSDDIHNVFNFYGSVEHMVDTSKVFYSPFDFTHKVDSRQPISKLYLFINPNVRLYFPNYEDRRYTTNVNTCGFMGTIPNAYSTPLVDLPDGEVVLNGKKYLSVPEIFNGNIWQYKEPDNNSITNTKFHEYIQQFSENVFNKGTKRINHFLLLALED